ncbi:MAG: AAA family ATPase, partial [Selenomonadaceae bacterium]|nr:AAA family ATPase [Selenomonadaceae bacterium]
MYIQRHLENAVRRASEQYPVVMVCGQRQAGKSTMLYHIKEEARQYITMDDANARQLAQRDPQLFFETYGAPLLIDEFQRAPSILL